MGREKLCDEGGVLNRLYTMNSDYISCTCCPGGANAGKNPEIPDKRKARGKHIPVTRFTCTGNTKDGIRVAPQNHPDYGINHIPALRPDR